MSLSIDLIDETNQLSEKEMDEMNALLNYAAAYEKVESESELSITIVSSEKIREINKEYRNKDAVTDVISFAMEEMGEGEMELVGLDMPRILGDIIISVERAKEQAEEYGHSFTRELGFLAVHGFLHLLGYDHETKEDEIEMFSRQKVILDEFGLQR
ncbi:putative rRNA maturation factor [Cytobacillus eiseniae]|uniref:Endoribonuclease YbeY n=1 Tax=Cytobacillus eiseniae TaxID=762947 RepID=A0ABS4RIL6_9BACI|nr:rRNA maturation RNase YbeY [Cytobacillus eiseniae]MBP2241667.1 putative rRNA maturation factor [Cytobacillus eiseniae]